MNIVVVCSKKMKYSSKVAESISHSINAKFIDMVQLDNISKTDVLIIVGGGPSSGENNSGIEGYVNRLSGDKVKHVGIITLDSNWRNTSVSNLYNIVGGQERLKKILQQKEIDFLGEHMCQCRFFLFCIGHPNKKDINKSIEWVKDTVKLCK